MPRRDVHVTYIADIFTDTHTLLRIVSRRMGGSVGKMATHDVEAAQQPLLNDDDPEARIA